MVLANGPIYACAKGSFNCFDRPDLKVKTHFRAAVGLLLVPPDTFPSGGSQRWGFGDGASQVLYNRHVWYGHTYSKSMDQPGKVANPARGQLNREKEYFPVRVRA